MNARYPDATAEEVSREDVCIICREDMRPWRAQDIAVGHQAGTEPTGNLTAAIDERLRPKRLPCGHILHFACLRSWLERQQNCPTCRRPVLMTGTAARTHDQAPADQHGRALPHINQAQVQAHGDFEQPIAAQNVYTFGPLRIAFGARQGVQGAAPQVNNNAPPPTQPGEVPVTGHLPRAASTFGSQRQVPGSQTRTVAAFSPTHVQLQLHQIEHQLIREIGSLRVQQNQLYLLRALQSEIARLRVAQANPDASFAGYASMNHPLRGVDTLPQAAGYANSFTASQQQPSMGSGHASLPAGMTLPQGWSVLPLQRLAQGRNANLGETPIVDSSSVQSQPASSDPDTGPFPQDRSQTNAAAHVAESSARLSGEPQSHHEHWKPGLGNSREISPTPRWRADPAFRLPSDALKSVEAATSGYEKSSKDGTDGNDPGPLSQTTAAGRQNKGKGKATTIEDSTEDPD